MLVVSIPPKGSKVLSKASWSLKISPKKLLARKIKNKFLTQFFVCFCDCQKKGGKKKRARRKRKERKRRRSRKKVFSRCSKVLLVLNKISPEIWEKKRKITVNYALRLPSPFHIYMKEILIRNCRCREEKMANASVAEWKKMMKFLSPASGIENVCRRFAHLCRGASSLNAWKFSSRYYSELSEWWKFEKK